MSITNATAEIKGSSNYTPPKKGPRPAILTGIIDVGVQPVEYKGESKKPCRQFVPVFTLVKDTYEDFEGDIKHSVVRPFPIKLYPGSEKSTYAKLVKALDPNHTILDSKGQGDVTQLIGQSCFLMIEHRESNEGKVFPRIAGYSEIPEDYPVEDIEYNPVVFDMNAPDPSVFSQLSDFLKGYIRESVGYLGSDVEKILDGGLPQSQVGDVEEDDDIPF